MSDSQNIQRNQPRDRGDGGGGVPYHESLPHSTFVPVLSLEVKVSLEGTSIFSEMSIECFFFLFIYFLFFGRFQINSQGIVSTTSTTLPENGIFNLKVTAKEAGNKASYLKSRIFLLSLKVARLFRSCLQYSHLAPWPLVNV